MPPPGTLSRGAEHHCAGSATALRRSIVVELLIPVGGRVLYGLLGCVASGADDDRVTTSIQIAGGRSPWSEPPLVGRLDEVEPWVDEEYHPGIAHGTALALADYRAFPQRLVFSCGAQGRAGSSINMFSRLAFVAVAFLSVPAAEVPSRLEQLLETWSRLAEPR
jgi:hypothetical protein